MNPPADQPPTAAAMDLTPPPAARPAPATASPNPPSRSAARPPATPARTPATPARVASANASAARLRTPFKSPLLKKAAAGTTTPAALARPLPPRSAGSSTAKPFRTPVRTTPAPPTKRAAPDTPVPLPPPAFRTSVLGNGAAAATPSTARPSPRRIGTAKIMSPATPRRAADHAAILDPDFAHYDMATRTAQKAARNVADKVRRLQRFHAYREKNELATVERLASKWRRLAARAGNLLVDAMRDDGGIEAMIADHAGSEPLPEGDVPKVFCKLQIPLAMLDYNANEDCLVEPESTNPD
ncbi:hypothetical protein, variant [Allomyces macrogynus ATCC 38327]|uniref:Swi5-dependent recombination DNA repair protein 1 homolog n=1 Tax=Allomyces macrogynus (strain ATCC 38327) TaxID=578462 RepID=A0A0L0T518_ALLM3|nr:hypothetical protein, variant [Allomyces macrogynus ATCC 38327]|eukprot:KNE69806.1 hypothetical protein, variant [Allomyces macrogynus ATCC 38327]